MTLNEIHSAIFALDKLEDLKSITQAVNLRWKSIQSQARVKFRVGQDVVFTDRQGYTINGKIMKINPKNIKVKSASGVQWNVSPNLLKAA